MTVQQTSIRAYLQERKRNIAREKQVYNTIRTANTGGIILFLRNGKVLTIYFPTDRELAHYLGFADPNMVRPRRRKLVQKGLVQDAGTRICTVTGKKAHTWKVTPK